MFFLYQYQNVKIFHNNNKSVLPQNFTESKVQKYHQLNVPEVSKVNKSTFYAEVLMHYVTAAFLFLVRMELISLTLYTV